MGLEKRNTLGRRFRKRLDAVKITARRTLTQGKKTCVDSRVGTYVRQLLAAPDHANDAYCKDVNDKRVETPDLSADKATFYIGQIPYWDPKTMPKDLGKGLLGFVPEERTYDLDSIDILVDFIVRNTTPGQKVKIILAGEVGLLMNKKPKTPVYTLNGQRQIIKHSFKTGTTRDFYQLYDGRSSDDLEIIRIDEADARNQTLFQQLRKYPLPEGGIDVKKTFEADGQAHPGEGPYRACDTAGSLTSRKNVASTISKDSTALEFAQFFYWVSHQPGNEKLLRAFQKLCPEAQRDQDAPESAKYYGMVEIAIRLCALINGQKVQGGMSRQEHYDDLIRDFIKAANDKKKKSELAKIKELKPLFELIKNEKDFTGVYIDTRHNYKKTKNRKRIRESPLTLTAIVAAGAITATTSFWVPALVEHARTCRPDEFEMPTEGAITDQTSTADFTDGGVDATTLDASPK